MSMWICTHIIYTHTHTNTHMYAGVQAYVYM